MTHNDRVLLALQFFTHEGNPEPLTGATGVGHVAKDAGYGPVVDFPLEPAIPVGMYYITASVSRDDSYSDVLHFMCTLKSVYAARAGLCCSKHQR